MQQNYEAGLAHLAAKRLHSAELSFRAAIASDPGFALAHYHLGLALRLRGAWQAADDAFRSAIACAPDLARAHAGLGAVRARLGETDAAEAALRNAIALDPQAEAGYLFLGDLLRGKGELGEARAVYEALLAKRPEDPDARFGRGFLALLEGDLAAGWKDYEFRLARRGPPDPALMPQWQGEDPAGKTLLLYAEQGIGDTIQFLRYAPLLAQKGAKVLVAVPFPVMELASRVDGVAGVVQPSLTLPSFDFCVPLPSLPLYCKTTLDNIPSAGGYLSPPTGKFALPPHDGLTVALSWAGNPDHPNDHNRSLKPADIRPLFEIRGVRWLTVQKGAGADELEQRNEIVRLGAALTNFSQTASVVCAADLVISVDTALCHLAGALGRPVWTLLPYAPDWRWLLERSDTPWYASMRLFRQPAPRDWTGVIAAISEAMASFGPRR